MIDVGSRPICLDMQATTPTGPRMLASILPVYIALRAKPHSCTQACIGEAEKAIGVAREYVAKLTRAHPKESISIVQTLQVEWYDTTCLPINNDGSINQQYLEIHPDAALNSIMTNGNEIGVIQPVEEIRNLCRKKALFFQTEGMQDTGQIATGIDKWNIDLMCISGPRVYGPKGIGACYIGHGPKVRIDLLSSGGRPECGHRSGSLAYSLAIYSGEARRIAHEPIEVLPSTPTSPAFCSSTVQDNSYIHKCYYNKQPKQFTRTLRTTGYNQAYVKRSKGKATTKDSSTGIQEDNLPEVPKTKGDRYSNAKRRNLKWDTSYSKITIREAQKLLGVRWEFFPETPVEEMRKGKIAILEPKAISEVKREIYRGLVGYIEVGGYPTEAAPDFKVAKIHDLVAFTIVPIIREFRRKTNRMLHMSREKAITSTDSSTSGVEEFVVMDYISVEQEKYVLVVEAKRASLGEAIKQCFLSLKDMRDFNCGGTVYGFVTNSEDWKMVSFDGEFKMGQDEGQWTENYSILIDCFHVALNQGAENPVEVP
ncbi:pyridoxal phosphate-dependent transferase [Tuber indicum]|nr:pyridoxal phosphate-dependent transferase [Tuber indicum]